MTAPHIDHIAAGCFAARIAYDLVPSRAGLRYIPLPQVRIATHVFPPARAALREQGYMVLK